MLTEVVMA